MFDPCFIRGQYLPYSSPRMPRRRVVDSHKTQHDSTMSFDRGLTIALQVTRHALHHPTPVLVTSVVESAIADLPAACSFAARYTRSCSPRPEAVCDGRALRTTKTRYSESSASPGLAAMPTPGPAVQELRLLFTPAENGSFTIHLEDSPAHPIGVPVPFTPFLSEDDFENLRWYLEEYMDLPDGGAVVRRRESKSRSKSGDIACTTRSLAHPRMPRC